MTFSKHRKARQIVQEMKTCSQERAQVMTSDGIWFSAGRPQFKVSRQSTEY